MKKPALLFLAHRIPFPPNKGDKIRSFNLLKSLSRDYQIYLGAFVDDGNDWQYEARLKEYCTEVYLLGIDNKQKYRSLTAFFTGEALSLPYYRRPRMQQWVDNKIASEGISRIFIYSSAMAQYVSNEKYQSCHRVVDFVDVDSEKWREYSRRRAWPMSWIYRREGIKLLEYDRRIASLFDASLFVSEQEAALFKTLAPESSQHITYINNGVDFRYFDPQHPLANPYPEKACILTFTGAMDYWANVDAVTWFVEEIFPAIKAKIPHAQFYIVGSRPAEEVLALEDKGGVHVTGGVEDIRPYILHSDVIVAPMRIARGIQNKVLEAMAMEKPVVATSAAMEGIEQVNGQAICNDEMSFVQGCIDLLEKGDPNKTGLAGRQRVLMDFNWNKNLFRLESLLGDIRPESSDVLQTENLRTVTSQEVLS